MKQLNFREMKLIRAGFIVCHQDGDCPAGQSCSKLMIVESETKFCLYE